MVQTEECLSPAADQLKTIISDPFDFHHLTHTNPTQFQSLDTTRETDLVTEFSAIRASQRPVTELKGIRADDIQYRDFVPEEFGPSGPVTPSEEPVSFAISTPSASPTASIPASPKQTDHKRRESRVFENFSRPVARYRRTSSTTPPPDFSEPAPRAIDEVLGLPSQQTYPEHVRSTPEDAGNAASLSQLNLAGMFAQEERPFSPVQDSGLNTRTSSVSLSNHALDLEDVPEEEEGTGVTQWHDSPESARPQTSGESSFGEPQPDARRSSNGPGSQLSIYVSADLSKKFSEVLGSPTLPPPALEELRKTSDGERQRRRSRASKRTAPETIYESWDADIDYCYEHAAESNDNFDWSRNSIDEPRRPESRIPIITSDGALQEGEKYPRHSIRLSHSTLPTPDLDSSPSRSLPTSHAAATPSTSGCEGEYTQGGGDYFHGVSSSMFPSALGKQMSQDALYEDYLAADAESDRHFSFCSQGGVQPIDHSLSPRSSFSPISKCNSQESLMISRAASVVRKHRSSVSTTSVPDLIHSLSGSRENMPADQMPPSEHVTSAAAALCRPGSANHRQTKSLGLARELDAHVMWRDSNSSLEPASGTASPTHDRTKSASAVEAQLPTPTIKPDVPFPGARKSINRKKGRASYSLFPFPGAAQ